MNHTNSRRGGDLEIVRETVMAEVPRGPELLRVMFTKARTPDGKDVAWHSIRLYYKNDAGEWRPGKVGITVRGGELHAVAAAFAKATNSGPREAVQSPAPATPTRSETAASGKAFPARYASPCNACGAQIAPGTMIVLANGKARHAQPCSAPASELAEDDDRI